ncbi:MAG: chromate resistance protein [Betaproteobacteria bacterium]|nr:chromate resistance protein [Betaproteobacteria bacterium]NBY05777.1 chromate resistance protein [Betaproteobacteria bacterium]
MKWVTRDFVHLDRVASPWLIKRFVDPQAEFLFVPWGQEDTRPSDAIPFGLPGVELGSHDEHGTTFEKIVRKYALTDASLHDIAAIIHAGVDHVVHHAKAGPDDRWGQIAVGLLAVAEGLILQHESDDDILKASFPIYDALYANLRVHAIVKEKNLQIPGNQKLGPTLPTRFLRQVLRNDG